MDSIRTYPLPPDGFDPHTAQPRELRSYGLPQRPDAALRPELTKLWDKVFSRSLTHVVPEFQSVAKVLPGMKARASVRPALPARPDISVSPELMTFDHPFWSAGIVHAGAGQMFNWVIGEWTVPDVAPPVSGEGDWYSFAWIGIDGTSDVTQIGTIQHVTTDGSGNVSKECYAVYEWFPNGWTAISNFPVSFGDTIIGLICLLSPTEAYVNLVNTTAGLRTGFDITPPDGIMSAENQIEWVFEHPGVDGESTQLPKFGEIYFDSAYGGQGLEYLANTGPDTVLNMVEDNVRVATVTVETPTLIKIAYTGN
jgi:hypothetical protein